MAASPQPRSPREDMSGSGRPSLVAGRSGKKLVLEANQSATMTNPDNSMSTVALRRGTSSMIPMNPDLVATQSRNSVRTSSHGCFPAASG